MAAPSFVQAGTGQVYTTGAAVTCSLAGATTGNVVILHGVVDGGGETMNIGTVTNIENLAGSASSITGLATLEQVGDGTERQSLFIGRATSSAPSVAVSTFGPDCYFRLYEFSNVNTGTTLSAVIENGTAGSYAFGNATSATISDVGVTTLGADRLACNFIAVNDDNQADFDTEAFTGMSGGTWVCRGSFGSSTGTDGSIGLQTAAMASAGTIDGGSLTMAVSDGWGVVGFALIGTTASTPTSFPPFQQLIASNYLR